MTPHPPLGPTTADALGLPRAEVRVEDHPDVLGPLGETIVVEDGLACFVGFANAAFVWGGGAALVVDPSSAVWGERAYKAFRQCTEEPLAHLVYTHRHGDHTAGAGWFTDHDEPRVWAHENLLAGWSRYRRTSGWQRSINMLQFAGVRDIPEMLDGRYVRPTDTFADRAELDLGGERVVLRHAKGETDDHCWVWLPERQVAVVGDMLVSAMPNAGNPQKVQRYVLEWAETLEEIASLQPRHVLPGHGVPLSGEEAAEQLTETARALRFVEDAVVSRLNDGKWPADIVDEEIRLPADLAAKPYLGQYYGCVPFLVRDVLRRYAGWWSGDGADLFPAPRAVWKRDVVDAVGPEPLLAKAKTLLADGEVQRALHLAELVHQAGVDEAHDVYVAALEARARAETSLIGRNLLAGRARRARGEDFGFSGDGDGC